MTGPYRDFHAVISQTIPTNRLFTDPLHTIAYGTDASFYRLIPKIVIFAQNAQEVSTVLKEAAARHLPVVFRAAGTSLSGQAITDSILLITSRDWKKIHVKNEGTLVTMEPSVLGTSVNEKLLPYGKKIGPDPASIGSAMIGGIAANNASGMCCGIADNSYKTLHTMQIVFHDGSELDTGSQESKDTFAKSHPELVEGIAALARKVNENTPLRDKINRKFKIKNTCGYSLNALVDFEDPFEIIQHLMIGSEGTLGFIKEITFKTVPEYKDKASALMIFKNIKDACDAIIVLKTQCRTRVENAEVDAAELMDRAGLRSVENKEGMPSFLKTLSETATAVLVETRAKDGETLDKNIATILEKLQHITPEMPLHFTKDVAEYTSYWKIRKGLFPAVGAVRETGTTVIIEDVAYPIESLADATLELQGLFKKYGYSEALIFGHALDSNLHFVFTQAFDDPKEVERYEAFMQEIADQVATKYQGSLKAEHGTGRNMAPFVELEWGTDAYALMKEIKALFDPNGLLNPGVILNEDPKVHLKNFKFMPATHPLVDKCIECGFCEPVCPSNVITFTPRQRIVANRHLSKLKSDLDMEGYRAFKAAYQYDGIETCATCSLCSLSCPVGINTGNLTKELRTAQIGEFAAKTAGFIGSHFGGVLGAMNVTLSVVKGVSSVLGDGVMTSLSKGARKVTNNALPLWTPSLTGGVSFKPKTQSRPNAPKVVYFSSCINRSLGNPKPQKEEATIHEVVIGLLERAGFEVVIPRGVGELCCGQAFLSKGYVKEGKRKNKELEDTLRAASNNGAYPIVCDMTSCSKTGRENFSPDLVMLDPIEFVLTHLKDKLTFTKIDEPVVVHAICSTRKMGLVDKFVEVAKLCSTQVHVPADVQCCGFAGDRGFTFPELNASALRDLKANIPAGTTLAFSTNKTCEIGLSEHSGLAYRNILYLVDRCTQ
ncbi:MAG: FAD-binding oxidoreductase [Campylobacterales bacterium]|nr:FAD-binding oxidoreductase [Campylobacterales bacterium]